MDERQGKGKCKEKQKDLSRSPSPSPLPVPSHPPQHRSLSRSPRQQRRSVSPSPSPSPSSPSPSSSSSSSSKHRRATAGRQPFHPRHLPTHTSSEPVIHPGLSPSTSSSSSSSTSTGLGSIWKRAANLYDHVRSSASEKRGPLGTFNLRDSFSSVLQTVSAAVATSIQQNSADNEQDSSSNTHGKKKISATLTPEPPFSEMELISSASMHTQPALHTDVFVSSVQLLNWLNSLLLLPASPFPFPSNGGFLSPCLFFSRSSLFLPSLKLPAFQQKLHCMQQVQQALQTANTALAASDINSEMQNIALLQLIQECNRIQNELAFSLSFIQETSTTSSNTQHATEIQETSTQSTGNGLDGASASPSPSHSPSLSASASHLSEKMKLLGYSVYRSANRLTKQMLTDRVTETDATLYLQSIGNISEAVNLLQATGIYSAQTSAEKQVDTTEPANVIYRCFQSLGVFLQTVVCAVVFDDLYETLKLNLKQQLTRFLSDPRLINSQTDREETTGENQQEDTQEKEKEKEKDKEQEWVVV